MSPLVRFFTRSVVLRAKAGWLRILAKFAVAAVLLALFMQLGARLNREKAELEHQIADAGADVVRLFWYAPPANVPNSLPDFIGAKTGVAYSVANGRCLDDKEASLPVLVLDVPTVRALGLSEETPVLYLKDECAGDGAVPVMLNRTGVLAPTFHHALLRRCLPYDRALLVTQPAAGMTSALHAVAYPMGTLDAGVVRGEVDRMRAIVPKGVVVKDSVDLLDKLAALTVRQSALRFGCAAAIACLLVLVLGVFAQLEFEKRAQVNAVLRTKGAGVALLAALELHEPVAILAVAFAVAARADVLAVMFPSLTEVVVRAGMSAQDGVVLGYAAGAFLLTFFLIQLRMFSRPIGVIMQ